MMRKALNRPAWLGRDRSKPLAEVLHETMLARARRRAKGLSFLSEAEITYWARRFQQRHVRYWTMCTFDKYISDPLLWEERRTLVIRRQGHGWRRRISSWQTGSEVSLPHIFN